MKWKSYSALLLAIELCCGAAWGAGYGDDAKKEKAKSAKPPGDHSELVFGTSAPIRTFKITVVSNDLETLKRENRAYVRATVTEGTNTFRDVGVHLKGMGSFQPLHGKPSFTVKFDRFFEGQEYFGLSRIMLNNSSQDPLYLAELIATWMFRDAGVPAPRVAHARVQFNGRDLGLYVLVEAENKDFLKRWFGNSKGNLYEAYLHDIDQRLDQDHGDETSQTDVKRLVEVCRIVNPAERWARLQQVLDVDRFISHQVCEMFTSHTDGYALNRNNYRIYRNPDTDRFTFIAHGLDWGYANTGVPIRPPHNTLVTKAVLQTAEGARAYRERVRTLYTNVFQLQVLTNRVNASVARLVANARSGNESNEFRSWGAQMNDRLAQRHRNILEQLNTPEPEPLKFDSTGLAKLRGWHKVIQSGEPLHAEVTEENKRVLRIGSGKGPCIASWRLRALLAPGKYVFEADARAAGLAPQSGGSGTGAGIRISGDRRDNKLEGDTGWTRLQYELNIEGAEREVVFVCELRALQGSVAFDADSLTLRKR